jgi:hypothetical protein
MEEWDPAINDFVLRCNSCWKTSKQYVKIIRTSREKYYGMVDAFNIVFRHRKPGLNNCLMP